MAERSHKAFLSYNSKDRPHVKRVAEMLERNGVECWFDDWDIRAGDKITREIERALAETDVCLAFLGVHGLGQWQKAEMEEVERCLLESRGRCNRFVPVLLPGRSTEGVEDLVPFGLRGSRWVAFQQSVDETGTLKQLLEVLRPDPEQSRRRSDAARLSSRAPSTMPLSLPYLCNRSEQEEQLRLLFEQCKAQPGGFGRPILCVIHGNEREAHRSFLDRLQSFSLRQRLEALRLTGLVRFLNFNVKPGVLPEDPARFAVAFRSQIADELQVGACADNAALWTAFEDLAKRQVRLLGPVLTLSEPEDLRRAESYFDRLRNFWAGFPDLPEGLALISFISIKLPSTPTWWRRLVPWSSAAGAARKEGQLRRWLAELGAAVAFDGRVRWQILAELKSPSFADVDRWYSLKEVSEILQPRGFSEKRLRDLFEGAPFLPMEDVIDKLTELLRAPAGP